jgi:hypothetical protein
MYSRLVYCLNLITKPTAALESWEAKILLNELAAQIYVEGSCREGGNC